MRCPYCCSQVAVHGDRPQPGWVGTAYRPGQDIVVLLQNPATPPSGYSSAREASAQQLLKKFANEPLEETYSELADFMLADAIGLNGEAWGLWKHPVSKLVKNPDQLAWLNVVKFRTPRESRKNNSVPADAIKHSIDVHLPHELQILKPKNIVAIGVVARKALERLNVPKDIVEHLEQRCKNEDIANLRKKLKLLE
jgi:hypothetical protein